MVNPALASDSPNRWVQFLARGLATCWSVLLGAYLLFNLVSAIASMATRPLQADGVVFLLLGLAVVLMPMLLAWRKEKQGGMALLAVGAAILAIGLIRPPGNLGGGDLAPALLTLALPPLAAGVLFLVDARTANDEDH